MIYYKGLFFQAAKVGIEFWTAKIVIKKLTPYLLTGKYFTGIAFTLYAL